MFYVYLLFRQMCIVYILFYIGTKKKVNLFDVLSLLNILLFLFKKIKI